MKQKIIVIVGPTASGKSELGVRIAKKLRGEIVSADSRQVYRGLDIGSGKVNGQWAETKNQKLKTKNKSIHWLADKIQNEYFYKGIRHHCIDIADPKKTFTAADFVACGRRAIVDILSRGKTPIIVGGTGFYIDALLGKIQLAVVPPNKTLRKKLSSYSTTQLFNYLTKFDPARAKAIDKNNPRRLIRAIEIVKAPPRQLRALERVLSAKRAWFFREAKKSVARNPEPRSLGAARKVKEPEVASEKIIWLGINPSPEDLKKRIHKRLMARLPGIIREVKKLRREGLSWKRLYNLGLEYRYVSQYIRAVLEVQPQKTKNVQPPTLDTIIFQLQTATWHYAKRQMTWWKKNNKVRWFNAPEKIFKYLRRTAR